MADANYSANRPEPGKVTLHASGNNPTTGYDPKFTASLLMIEPPQFVFENPKPTGMQGEMVIAFDISKTFQFPSVSDIVTISDSSGSYGIKIG